MKIICVYSEDSDYGAKLFEDSKFNNKEDIRRLYNEAKANEDGFTTQLVHDDGYFMEELIVEAFEFGEVDPKFIEFIYDKFIDCDETKYKNIFIVEE